MKSAFFGGKEISKEEVEKVKNGIELAGLSIKLSEGFDVVSEMHISSTLEKLEVMAGCEKDYIQKLMFEKFVPVIKEIGIEICKLQSKALENMTTEFYKVMEDKISGI